MLSSNRRILITITVIDVKMYATGKYILCFLVGLFSSCWLMGMMTSPASYYTPPSSIPRYPKNVVIDRILDIEQNIDLRANHYVRKRISSYVLKGRNFTEKIIGESSIYFPIFQYYLKQHNVPDELKYLAVVESKLDPQARSQVGAAGLWQFMPRTGKLYGLKINDYVDERYDIHRSSEAAARYLKDLNERFGDWTLAIAAYNCGPGNLNKAIRRSKSRNFWKLQKFLPKETREYVQRFAVIKYVFNYYMFYGLMPAYPDYDLMLTQMVRVYKRTYLKDVAKAAGIDIEILAKLNSGYRKRIIPPNPVGYYLILPRIGIDEAIAGKYISLRRTQ